MIKILMNKKTITWLLLSLVALLAGCSNSEISPTPELEIAPPTNLPAATETSTSATEPDPTAVPEAFEMAITGFNIGEIIPDRFACLGENISPEISWNAAPSETQSFVFIFDDPDASSRAWVHWILFNIPSTVSGLQENISPGMYPEGSLSGANSWGELPYGGPCPPVGSTHEYVFVLYALDLYLDLDEGASKAEILAGMEGHILAESLYTGLYSR
jgi:hypothetical protein